MKKKMTVGSVMHRRLEPGFYNAKFFSCRERTGLYGEVAELSFVVSIEGTIDTFFTVLATPAISLPKENKKPSKLYEIVTALLGRPVEKGEEIDLDDLMGMYCQIFVDDKEGNEYQVITQFKPVAADFVPIKKPSPFDEVAKK